MPDELVGEENPFLAGDDAHQVLLDFLWVGILRQFEAAGDAGDVGIDDDSFGELEPAAEYDVCGFAGHAWEGEQVVHVERDLAAEVGNNFSCGADYGLGLVAEEAGGADVGLELLRLQGGEGFDGGIFAEEFGGDAVDVHIRRLGGEDCRHQKFPGARVG